MPGTFLNAGARNHIAQSLITLSNHSDTREDLIEIYKISRFTLVKGELFISVTDQLAKRAFELGVYQKGGNNNA